MNKEQNSATTARYIQFLESELDKAQGSSAGNTPATPSASHAIADTPPPFPVGTQVYVRTLSYHVCGEIEGTQGPWLHLKRAAYVGTDGRYHDALDKGLDAVSGAEIEPVPGDGHMRVHITNIADVAEHPRDLPRTQK